MSDIFDSALRSVSASSDPADDGLSDALAKFKSSNQPDVFSDALSKVKSANLPAVFSDALASVRGGSGLSGQIGGNGNHGTDGVPPPAWMRPQGSPVPVTVRTVAPSLPIDNGIGLFDIPQLVQNIQGGSMPNGPVAPKPAPVNPKGQMDPSGRFMMSPETQSFDNAINQTANVPNWNPVHSPVLDAIDTAVKNIGDGDQPTNNQIADVATNAMQKVYGILGIPWTPQSSDVFHGIAKSGAAFTNPVSLANFAGTVAVSPVDVAKQVVTSARKALPGWVPGSIPSDGLEDYVENLIQTLAIAHGAIHGGLGLADKVGDASGVGLDSGSFEATPKDSSTSLLTPASQNFAVNGSTVQPNESAQVSDIKSSPGNVAAIIQHVADVGPTLTESETAHAAQSLGVNPEDVTHAIQQVTESTVHPDPASGAVQSDIASQAEHPHTDTANVQEPGNGTVASDAGVANRPEPIETWVTPPNEDGPGGPIDVLSRQDGNVTFRIEREGADPVIHTWPESEFQEAMHEYGAEKMAPEKEPWNLTRSDYIGNSDGPLSDLKSNIHEASVRAALLDGQNVMPDVMADYPHLADRYNVGSGGEPLRRMESDDPRLHPESPEYNQRIASAVYKELYGADAPTENGELTPDAHRLIAQGLDKELLNRTPKDMGDDPRAVLKDIKDRIKGSTQDFWRVFKNGKGDNTVDYRSPTKFVSLEGLPHDIQQAIMDHASGMAADHSYITDQQLRDWRTAGKPRLSGVRDMNEVMGANLGYDEFSDGRGGQPLTSGLDRAVVPRKALADFARNYEWAIDHNEGLAKNAKGPPTDAELDAAANHVLRTEPTPVDDSTGISNRAQQREVDSNEIKSPEKGQTVSSEEAHAMGKGTTIEEGESLARQVANKTALFSAEAVGKLTEVARLFKVQARDLSLEMAEARMSGDGVRYQELLNRYTELADRRQSFLDNVQKGKTEWHNTGMALQAMTTLDGGDFEDMSALAAKNAGRPLSIEESEEFRKMTDDVKGIDQRIKALEESKANIDAQDSVNHQVGKPSAPSVRDAAIQRMKDNATKLAKLVLTPGVLGSGPADFFDKFPEAKAIVKELAKDAVIAGKATLADMYAEVRLRMHEAGVPVVLTDREIRDAFTSEDSAPKTRSEAQQRLAEMRSVAKVESQIEDLTNGKTPAEKSLAGRAKPSDILADARKRLAEAEKSAKSRNAAPDDPTLAATKRLGKLLDILENGPKEKAAKTPITPSMVAVNDKITKTIQAIRDKWGESAEIKRERELVKQIADARDELINGPKDKTAQVEGPPTARIDALQKELADVRQQIQDKYKGTPEARVLARMQAKYLDLEKQFETNTRKTAVDKGGFDSDDMQAAKQQLRDMQGKVNTQDQINELERKLRENDFVKPSKESTTADQQLKELRERRDMLATKVKQKAAAMEPKTLTKRIGDGFIDWVRMAAISGLKTAGAVATSNIGHAVASFPDEAMGEVAKYGPGARDAGTETRFSPAAEVAAIKALADVRGNWKGVVDRVFSPVGGDRLDVKADQLGIKPLEKQSALMRMATALHVLASEPVKMAAFERQWVKSLEEAQRNGLDPNNEKVRVAAFADSYAAAQRATLMNDSYGTKVIQGIIKPTGNFGRAALPVAHLPINAVGRALEYQGVGAMHSLGKVAKAMINGSDLTLEERQGIARTYKRAGVGAAAMAYGAWSKSWTVDKNGDLLFNGKNVDLLSHVPFIGAIKMGVLMRQYNGNLAQKLFGGAIQGDLYSISRAPGISQMRTIGDVLKSHQSGDSIQKTTGKVIGAQAASMLVPAMGREWATGELGNIPGSRPAATLSPKDGIQEFMRDIPFVNKGVQTKEVAKEIADYKRSSK